MNRSLKIAIGLATIGVVGVVGYFVYKKIKDARDAKSGNEGDGNIQPPSVVVGGDENSNEKTPFKNKAQGDIFRQFVNRFYPSYAREIDLDVSGEADNAFMRKAFGKYGNAYKKYNPNFIKASGTSIPKNLLDAYALRKDKGSFGNNSEGAIFLQTSSLGTIDNEKIVAFFYASGNVSFTKGGKRVRFDKWWNNGKSINSGKNYSGTDYFNTAFKVFEALKKGDETLDTLGLQANLRTFPFDGNLQGDLEAPTRKGLGIDTNIID
jgi:hypothetical protein